METISPLLLYSAAIDIQRIYMILEQSKDSRTAGTLVTGDDCAKIAPLMSAISSELIKFSCPVSAASAQKPIDLMHQGELTYEHVTEFLKELDGRIRDEIKQTYAFCLNPIESSLFDPAEPLLGWDVQLKFETAQFDIEEAAKCHALGRSTSAVFHSFRVLEIGIRALARCLRAKDLEKPSMRNWGNILGAIEAEIKARWPKETDRDSGDGELFWEVYTLMAAIRTPRNGTMHPARKYTEQEADRIVRIVGDIMRRLAERMDENGEPKLRTRRTKTLRSSLVTAHRRAET